MGIVGNLCGRNMEIIRDIYGRWCGFLLKGCDKRKILIMTAYQVPQRAPPGDTTLYAQQDALYRMNGIQEPKIRQQFIIDLENSSPQLPPTGMQYHHRWRL